MRLILPLLAICATLLLSGCGQKGDLYLSDKPDGESTEEAK